MNLVWGPDISNYDGALAPLVAALEGAGAGAAAVRASLESAALQQAAVEQLTALQGSPVLDFCYQWCYGDWTPEQAVQQTVQLVDPYLSIKRIAWDVEDTQNFLRAQKRGMIARLPGRIAVVDLARPHLASLSPQAALDWLQRAVAETTKLGYAATLYTAPWAWTQLLADTTALAAVDLWTALWDDNPDLAVWTPYGGWTNPLGKQYYSGDAGTIQVGGHSFDLNVWDLDRLQAVPAAQPPPPSGDNQYVLAADYAADKAQWQRFMDVVAWRFAGIEQFANLQNTPPQQGGGS